MIPVPRLVLRYSEDQGWANTFFCSKEHSDPSSFAGYHNDAFYVYDNGELPYRDSRWYQLNGVNHKSIDVLLNLAGRTEAPFVLSAWFVGTNLRGSPVISNRQLSTFCAVMTAHS